MSIVSVFDSPQPDVVARKAHDLYAEGVQGFIAYISPGNPSGEKTIKKPQAEAILAAGIAIAFVCETYGGSNNFVHHDITAAFGTRDGGFCGHYMQTLGVPAGVMCAPTIDNDANPQQLRDLCLPYFRAFRAACDPNYRLGAYGPGSLLFALEAEQHKILDVPWLSNALGWSRSREYLATGRAVITQQRESRLLGIDIDPDVVKGDLAAAGFWMPAPASVQPLDR